ncbi:MAG: hypothetical protein AAGU74_07285 [Bacillota bacterium]
MFDHAEYRKLKTSFIIMMSITAILVIVFIITLFTDDNIDLETVLTFLWVLGFPWGVRYWIQNWRDGKVHVLIGMFFGFFIMPVAIFRYVADLKEMSARRNE